MKLQYPGKVINGKQYYNIPWSVRQAFSAKWNPIVQQADRNQAAASNNPSIPYNQFTPQQKQTYDNRIDSAAAKAAANPSFPDPAPTTPQPSPVDEVAATYESKIKELQDMIAQQTADFASQQQQMQEGLAAQQAAYNKQAQQMANSQRAYTPAPEATATETTTTDSGLTTRRTARSGLTSLAIIEGLGTNANPLSGLQLA